MLKGLEKQAVTIYFLDGSCVRGGTLEEVNEAFVKYKDEFEMLYVPISSIRAVAADRKVREQPKIGFSAQ
ncbi:hypothetical protein [Paenibacillus campinasensis]|uniref:Uncharacterized protein n=1 Tax=Paenibacillus campinasensis TaxID=66347 RepID=A0A268ERQ6_9BACL|nr:hypothetical protein [Paenibacillus campinasensis]PAD75812.1 hypothetical protein CHH67_14315 [Paenibacillus campinasensis]